MIRRSLLAALPIALIASTAVAQYAGPALNNQVLLETQKTILDQPIAYPKGAAKITSTLLTIQPGGETAWHIHQVPLLVHVLDGEVTVDYGSKGVKVYKTGETFIEAMNWVHKGMNKSDKPVKLFTVYMGAEGVPNAETADAPK